jgi:hypothetical protein
MILGLPWPECRHGTVVIEPRSGDARLGNSDLSGLWTNNEIGRWEAGQIAKNDAGGRKGAYTRECP